MSVSARSEMGLWQAVAAIWPGALWLGFATLAGALAFHDGIAALLAAWQLPEYSHGPLIPLISGYLFLRQLKRVPPHGGPVADRWPGAALMGGALCLGLVGVAAGIDDIVAYALILWIGGMIVASFGWARGRQFWPPVLHLCFMLPLPGVLYYKTSLALQTLSSEVGVSMIRLAGIPVFLDGTIIDLDVIKLHVAEACSGLRYLFPVMSFTYIFAVLYRGAFWIKATLLLAAVPIAVGLNAMRVGMIGIMVDLRGVEHAEGFMHAFEGWVVFGLCVAATIALAWALKRLSGDRRLLLAVLDLDGSGTGAAALRAGDVRPSAALLLPAAAAAIAGALVVASPGLGRAAPEIDRDPFALFPRQLGAWASAYQESLPPEIAAALGADDHLSAEYERPGEPPVSLFAAWYRDQSAGGIHSPEICIPAGGWEMSEIGSARMVVATAAGPRALSFNRAVIRKGLERRLVYYWFDQRGRSIASDYLAKAALLWDAVANGRTDGALVRLVTPIEPVPGQTGAASEAAAAARLDALLAEALPVLPRFIGGDESDGFGRSDQESER